jgi:hypothetical protein
MPPEACSHKHVGSFELGIYCLSCGAVRSAVPETIPIASVEARSQLEEEYQYNVLDRDQEEIRLIELLPAANKDRISCRVITVGLNLAPAYVAISYTWTTEDGDASRRQQIYVHTDSSGGRQIIKVTLNCEQALRQVRHQQSKRTVWIDCICINQEKVSERNYQVGIMDRIYKRSSRVDICIQTQEQDVRGLLIWFATQGSAEGSKMNSDEQYFDQETHVGEVATLFGMRYFSRVWVRWVTQV